MPSFPGMDLNDHYRLLLGLDGAWKVSDVRLDVAGRNVDIYLEHVGDGAPCPVCGRSCRLHDHAPERRWRHLDTMQFTTTVHATPPRTDCPEHGVKTAEVPWAGRNARFTLLFEAFAVEVIRACRNVKDAAGLLRLDWHSTFQIMERAVQRGLSRRRPEEIPWVGIDEKSFLRGRKFVSLLTDVEGRRVLDVEPGRDSQVAKTLIDKALDRFQRDMVCGVAMDLSAPFEKAVREKLPNADVVADRFHVTKLLADAVDKVRRRESAILAKRHDNRLKRTKYLWLAGMEHLSPENLARLEDLSRQSLLVAKAWRVKYAFEAFWTRRDKTFARQYFRHWFKEAVATGLPPVVKAAQSLKRHLEKLLSWYDSFISNALTEGMNSKIQALKANARGYRAFENYRTAILFSCGRLDMSPLPGNALATP